MTPQQACKIADLRAMQLVKRATATILASLPLFALLAVIALAPLFFCRTGGGRHYPKVLPLPSADWWFPLLLCGIIKWRPANVPGTPLRNIFSFIR